MKGKTNVQIVKNQLLPNKMYYIMSKRPKTTHKKLKNLLTKNLKTKSLNRPDNASEKGRRRVEDYRVHWKKRKNFHNVCKKSEWRTPNEDTDVSVRDLTFVKHQYVELR